jgi:hypothetical protein
MVNFLFVKKAWDKRFKLGVLVQLERIWIIIERFFAPRTFKVIMRFLSRNSFYKKYVLYDETISINGFSIEYQTYSVLLKLLVIGGGLYCAKSLGSSHTKRHKRASNGQVLTMFGLCAASAFLLAGVIFPVLRSHHCISYDTFSPYLELRSVPQVHQQEDWNEKITPGVSTFDNKPDDVWDHYEPLIEHAENIIPKDQWNETPIFVLATAGMRLLPEKKRNKDLWKLISSYLQPTHWKEASYMLDQLN